MRISILLIFSVLLFCGSGCTTSQKAMESVVLKENQKKGVVIQQAKRTRTGVLDELEFYLQIDNLNYFVKFSESKVTPTELNKHLNKTIIFEGSIKNGPWEKPKTGSLSTNEEPQKAREGMYVTIDKILGKKDITP